MLRRKSPPPRPVKTIEGYTPRPRECARSDGVARMSVAVPKNKPIQHRGYMAAVRKLPCYLCGVVGLTQFCHADEGKGMGIKSDCRFGWPGCGPVLGSPGCHYLVGTSGAWTKDERREFEARAARHTRLHIRMCGLWPADLPLIEEDEREALIRGIWPDGVAVPDTKEPA